MLSKLHLHKKSKGVCIKTRSPAALLPIGYWPIGNRMKVLYMYFHKLSQIGENIFPHQVTSIALIFVCQECVYTLPLRNLTEHTVQCGQYGWLLLLEVIIGLLFCLPQKISFDLFCRSFQVRVSLLLMMQYM